MHRLAAGARHRRARGQNRPPDGWTTIKNGELLALASNGFDVFVTLDRNLPSQHDLSALSVAVVVLRAKSSRLTDLEPLVPMLLIAIEAARPGTAVVVREETD